MFDPIWLELVGLFLTLIVLLYMIFGDNALFRIVVYSFVGIASGYVTVLLIFQVLLPRLFQALRGENPVALALGLAPFVLGLLLFFKLSPRLSAVGVLPMAALVGVGAAVAVGGALFGTLFGQVLATIGMFRLSGAGGDFLPRLAEGLFILFGAAATLAYFHFGARRPVTAPAETTTPAGASLSARRSALLDVLAKAGQIFIGITLGAVFAGVYTAAITALIERIGFVMDVLNQVMVKFF